QRVNQYVSISGPCDRYGERACRTALHQSQTVVLAPLTAKVLKPEIARVPTGHLAATSPKFGGKAATTALEARRTAKMSVLPEASYRATRSGSSSRRAAPVESTVT